MAEKPDEPKTMSQEERKERRLDSKNTQPNQTSNKDRDAEYEERFNLFTENLDKLLKDEDVQLAILILIDPKTNTPILYTKGQTWPLARLAVDVVKYLKHKLNAELSV